MLQVKYHDNRGSDKTWFGYVYFSDGTRVGYTSGKDAELFGGNWGGNTEEHFRLAARHLEKAGMPLK